MKCPACGVQGDLTDESLFEVRGQWKNRPVRKCAACGAGFRVRVLMGPQLLSRELWGQMQDSWERNFPAEAPQDRLIPIGPPEAGALVDAFLVQGRENHPELRSAEDATILRVLMEATKAVEATAGNYEESIRKVSTELTLGMVGPDAWLPSGISPLAFAELSGQAVAYAIREGFTQDLVVLGAIHLGLGED
jgi:hypothetical protein